jgi:hypothetical protein
VWTSAELVWNIKVAYGTTRGRCSTAGPPTSTSREGVPDDADQTVGALYASIGGVRDLLVTGAGFEEALITLSSAKAA